MALLSKCCCCSLQAGVITIGALGLVIPGILTAVVIYLMVLMGVATVGVQATISEQDDQMKQLLEQAQGMGMDMSDNDEIAKNMAGYDNSKDAANNMLGLGWGVLCGIAVVLILYIVMNILLIVGAAKSKGGLLIPWLAYTVLAIILNVVGVAYTAIAASLNVGMLVQAVFTIGLTGFMWVCVFSLYQEIGERTNNQSYQQPMQKM